MSKEVRHDGAGALEIRFSFDSALVELIKSLPNRRWIATERYWRVPVDDVVRLVETLRPLDFRFDSATRAAYLGQGGTAALDDRSALPGLFDPPESGASDVSAPLHPTDHTVSELNRRVKQAIEAAFPQAVWLIGEISGFNRNARKKHVTFQLVEHDPSGKSLSKIDATLFDTERRAIESALARAGDPFRMEDEVAVRVRARVELYVPWGSYRVVVEELDPAFTLGEAARRREEIVRRLTLAGLIERNRTLPFPALPLRVGLITSLGSDAHQDVLRTLEESGYAFQVVSHGARVQGRATEPSVLNALDFFREHSTEFDAVLICRGGGSRTDLAWFDSEALGRAVATFPLPVVVGIGHEQDRSVLDEVGRRSKTPTAAAGYLVERVRESVDSLERAAAAVLGSAGAALIDENRRLGERGRRLVAGSKALLAAAEQRLVGRQRDLPRAASVHLTRQRSFLESARRSIVQGARRDVGTARRKVNEQLGVLGPRAERRLAVELERVESRGRRLELVDPRRVVERGYAILRSARGKVVTDADSAPAGVQLAVELRRGKLAVRSEGPETRSLGGNGRR